MSVTCQINSGRLRQCKNTVGGLKTLFLGLLTDFDSGITQGGTYGEIDGLPTATLYRFELDQAFSGGSLVATFNASPDNGTTFYEHVVVTKFKKLSAQDNENFQNIVASQLVAFVLTNNDEIMMVGLKNGADITAGDLNTGLAMGDMSGYNITITAREPELPKYLEAYTSEPFDNFAGITVSPAYPTGS